ncbi:MAG: sigma-70 family RNA polymerase sigma factor, partial [Candidatus Baltobacteraceae bacterium]
QVVDEVTQSAFVSLWNRAASYRPEAGRVRAWVTTIARNALIDRTRRRRLSVVPLDRAGDWPAADSAPEQQVTDRERHRDIVRALADLGDDQRQAIELAFFGGLSQSEIARALGEPLGTVKSRIRLGMQKLRRALGPTNGEF